MRFFAVVVPGTFQQPLSSFFSFPFVCTRLIPVCTVHFVGCTLKYQKVTHAWGWQGARNLIRPYVFFPLVNGSHLNDCLWDVFTVVAKHTSRWNCTYVLLFLYRGGVNAAICTQYYIRHTVNCRNASQKHTYYPALNPRWDDEKTHNTDIKPRCGGIDRVSKNLFKLFKRAKRVALKFARGCETHLYLLLRFETI